MTPHPTPAGHSGYVQPSTPQLLTVPEVMAALHLSRSTVYQLIRRGELPSLTIGHTRRIPTTALHTYVNQHLEHAA